MAKKKSQLKESILTNYGFVVLDHSAQHSFLVKGEEDVQRMLLNGEIGHGDIIIQITPENVRVAEKRDYIEIV